MCLISMKIRCARIDFVQRTNHVIFQNNIKKIMFFQRKKKEAIALLMCFADVISKSANIPEYLMF